MTEFKLLNQLISSNFSTKCKVAERVRPIERRLVQSPAAQRVHLHVPIDRALDIESRYFVQLTLGPVHRNMIRTLFINKGAADKLARRPEGVEESRVQKLGVLGAGMMGGRRDPLAAKRKAC